MLADWKYGFRGQQYEVAAASKFHRFVPNVYIAEKYHKKIASYRIELSSLEYFSRYLREDKILRRPFPWL